MQIFVDADACPVVAIIEKIAKDNSVPVMLLCDLENIFYMGGWKKIQHRQNFENRAMRQQKGRRCRNDVHLYDTGTGKPFIL